MARPRLRQLYSAMAHSALDRASVKRKDPAWLRDMVRRGDARWAVVWRDRNLASARPEARPGLFGAFDEDAKLRPEYLTTEDLCSALGVEAAAVEAAATFLGVCKRSGRPYFAIDAFTMLQRHAGADAAEKNPCKPGGGLHGRMNPERDAPFAFLPLRSMGTVLDPFDANLLAYAKGIVWWQQHAAFDGSDGSRTRLEEGGHVAVGGGGERTFPRVDPAIICLVEDADGNVLLGRQPRWPRGMYSTLAGFCEVAESLEDAVAREVNEEVGLHVEDVRYYASQPWPFPQSLMLGFFATCAGRRPTLTLDQDELEDARWFSHSEVRPPERAPGPASSSRI